MVPTLVLLPGMDGTGDLFAPLVAALGPHMRTIIVRYPDEPLDYASHEEIARAALPLGHPFILLGESFSGPIAVSIAASAPTGLRGYVLCCSFVRSPRRLLRWFRPSLGLLPAHRAPGEGPGCISARHEGPAGPQVGCQGFHPTIGRATCRGY
jgi:pimeloyl-ACP methyl ester carboxylesterase